MRDRRLRGGDAGEEGRDGGEEGVEVVVVDEVAGVRNLDPLAIADAAHHALAQLGAELVAGLASDQKQRALDLLQLVPEVRLGPRRQVGAEPFFP